MKLVAFSTRAVIAHCDARFPISFVSLTSVRPHHARVVHERRPSRGGLIHKSTLPRRVATAEGSRGQAHAPRLGSPPPPCFAWSPSPLRGRGSLDAARAGIASLKRQRAPERAGRTRNAHGYRGRESRHLRGGRGAVELGPLGQGRPDRHAQPRHAGRHRRRREARAQGQGVRARHPAERAVRSAACSAGAGTRSTPCSRPAPTPSPAARTRPPLRYADDAINMPMQAATHWDSLGHIFHGDKMYNGTTPRCVDASGVQQARHRATRDKMVGRGVLLDIARCKGVDSLEDGYGISNDELDACAKAQGVEIRKGDFVIVRTGQMEPACTRRVGRLRRRRRAGRQVRELLLVQEKRDRRRSAPTPGACEVRPNETKDVQPALALGGDPGHGPLPWARCST